MKCRNLEKSVNNVKFIICIFIACLISLSISVKIKKNTFGGNSKLSRSSFLSTSEEQGDDFEDLNTFTSDFGSFNDFEGEANEDKTQKEIQKPKVEEKEKLIEDNIKPKETKQNYDDLDDDDDAEVSNSKTETSKISFKANKNSTDTEKSKPNSGKIVAEKPNSNNSSIQNQNKKIDVINTSEKKSVDIDVQNNMVSKKYAAIQNKLESNSYKNIKKKYTAQNSIQVNKTSQKKLNTSQTKQASNTQSNRNNKKETNIPKNKPNYIEKPKTIPIIQEPEKKQIDQSKAMPKYLLSSNKENNYENDKLFTQLDPKFVQNLLKVQNDPNLKSLLSGGSFLNNQNYPKFIEIPNKVEDKNENIQQIPKTLNTKEKINKNNLKNYYKPEELDMSNLTYINDLLKKVRNDVNKKTAENEQLFETNNQLEKNYEQLNGQLIITQTKMDSVMNEINMFDSVKNSYANQIEKIKEGNSMINDIGEYFRKINEDIANQEDSILKYGTKVEEDLKNLTTEKNKLESTYNKKIKNLEGFKSSYAITEGEKNKLIENIKKTYEGFSKEEIKYLKLKNEENELELKVKSEESAEKLIALEIEHLKTTNMLEIQKIEELKQEIEKSENLKKYMKTEIDELEEKLKNAENENKQNQIEYELKKNELEEKLNSLKEEMKNEESLNNEEKEKYNQIETDIKNKISYVSLHNTNVLGKNADYVSQNNSSVTNSEVPNEEDSKENKQKINNLVNAFYSFKKKDSPNKENVDDNKFKSHILSLLKKLNE